MMAIIMVNFLYLDVFYNIKDKYQVPSELLNNYILNNGIQNAPVLQTAATQPALQNANIQSQQNAKIDTAVGKTDTFEKKNNKKAFIGGITAGILILGGGFILLAKKGKLGEGCKNFANKIFGSKTANNAVDSVQSITGKTEITGTKQYLLPEICPEKINEETGEILYRAEVSFNPESITDDLNDWAVKRANLSKMSQHTTGCPINPVFSEFEIKPHSYIDDTRIFVSARDYTRDFANYEIENGAMKRLNGTIQECTKEPSATEMFDIQKNKRCLQAGHFDDGRKYVSFAYTNGETYENGRMGYETVMLVSNSTEFTQSQKDAIRIFKTIADDADPKTPIPMYLASATTGGAKICGSDSELVKRFNKNALLSAISSWAEHSPEFDADKYIEKAGDTFRTGYKCKRLGNLNQID